MISTTPADRVKRNKLLDQLCTGRPCLWEPINAMDQLDGLLWGEQSGKLKGLVRVISNQGKYGNKPVVEIPKEPVDFLDELGKLTTTRSALVIKFRDTAKYWRVENVDRLNVTQVTKRGKLITMYELPIGELQDIVKVTNDIKRKAPPQELRDK